jgi:hypothetical protein
MLPGLLLVVKHFARTAKPSEYWVIVGLLWLLIMLPGLLLVVKHLARTAEPLEYG